MRGRLAAGAAGTTVLILCVGAVALTVTAGWSFARALDSFVVSNLLIGTSFGLCGWLIAVHRPGSPLGWLYLAGGLCQTATALATPLAEVVQEAGAGAGMTRLVVTVQQWGWPVNIALIPLTLLLLPDGRLPSPRWRPVVLVLALTAPLFVLEIGLQPEPPPGLPAAYLSLEAGRYDDLAWLWLVSEARWAVSLAVGLAALLVRYVRGDEVVRRQLLWLVAAAGVVLVAVTPWALVAGTPMLVLFTIPLLPTAIAVSVVRHQLLDIRLVIARGATYALLSGLVLAGYAALVVVLSGTISALVVALLALPLRARLQRAVDRLLYGERGNPLGVASRVGRSMGHGLPGALEEVRVALRLPYVALAVGPQLLAESGRSDGPSVTVPLAEGTLVVGLRSGETRLSAADERVLALLAGPLSTAVRATRLLEELQVSRERLVVAREDERRRLRQELHDGLGPLLTGVALSADAASNLAAGRGGEADDVADRLAEVRAGAREAIVEVRRLVDGLGSPTLDEVGLVESLRLRAAQLRQRADGAPLVVRVEARELPELSAATEQAVYRIAAEAMLNAGRHSRAASVVVSLAADGDRVRCEVRDDGPDPGPWVPGVGIRGMRDRVAELGGDCEVRFGPDGGLVRVWLPSASEVAVG